MWKVVIIDWRRPRELRSILTDDPTEAQCRAEAERGPGRLVITMQLLSAPALPRRGEYRWRWFV